MRVQFSRRQFIKAGALLGTLAAFGCTGGTASSEPPAWLTIPDQVWVVGIPVHLDLAEYCTDADGDELSFALSESLPPGLTLEGSVISGTPTGPFDATAFVAMAEAS